MSINVPKKRVKIRINHMLPLDCDLSILNSTERLIIEMRFGLGKYSRRHTHREISLVVNNLPFGRIGTMEKKAIVKLRKEIELRDK